MLKCLKEKSHWQNPHLSSLFIQDNEVHRQEHRIGSDMESVLLLEKTLNFSRFPAKEASGKSIYMCKMHKYIHFKMENKILKKLYLTLTLILLHEMNDPHFLHTKCTAI